MNNQPPLNATEDILPSGDNLEAGLAAAFGPDSGPPLPAGSSVLPALRAGLPAVPRIRLREPDAFGSAPSVRPAEEMPPQQDPAAARDLAAPWSFWTTGDAPDKQDPAVGADSDRAGTIYAPEEMMDRQGSGARLQLHGEIARGGMGAVLRGRDVDLGREVAVKVLLERHQDKTGMLQRFIEEAQISGQLQHPGITPVYELGQLADKRLYFTMKLVKGKTLAALLAARKATDEERTRYVGIFAQICQTLAYAHARGVIHRDLKPSNVMVGAFGEVQVMDWGLAKVLQEGGGAETQPPAEVSAIRTQRSEGSSTPELGSHTQAGTVLGTPAYMAPEQARGDVALVDERADVFGLGAILCEILTGQPPYGGKYAEITYKARTAQREEACARLDACGADGELIALTKHCLAAEPCERPRHAGEVAEQVTAYQQSVAERLRQAELAQTEARTRAEEEARTRAEAEARLGAERRARRLTLGLAAVGLLALTLVGSGGLWYQQQTAERREETARRETERREEAARREAERREETARQEAERREAVKAALDKVADLRQGARWGEARAVLEHVRQRLGSSGPADLRRQMEQVEADLKLVDRLEAARLKASVWVGYHFDKAVAAREYAAAFREAGIGEDTETAAVVAARIRASAVRDQLVAAVDNWAILLPSEEPVRRAWLLAVARAADPDPSWRDHFRTVKVWYNRKALERLARAAKVNELSPQMLFTLGVLLDHVGADAVPLLTAAQRHYPSDFWLNYQLGNTWSNAKRWEEAIGYYRAASALRPATSAVHDSLGRCLRNMGRVDEALTEYHKALECSSEDAVAHNGLGVILCDVKHDYEGAIACFRKALAIVPRDARVHYNLGNALKNKGRVNEAITSYQTAIEIDPWYAPTHNDLGIALENKGRVNEAIAAYHKAIAIDPRYAPAQNNLGDILCRSKRDYEGAIACFRKAIAIDPKLAVAHHNLALALVRKGLVDEAIAAWKEALEIDPRLAYVHFNLGVALENKGRVDEAIAAYHRAIATDPRYAPAHDGLGAILCDVKGDYDGAIACFRKAIAIDPQDASIHYNLGVALRAKGRLNEAIAEWKKAIEIDPRNTSAHNEITLLEPIVPLQSKLPTYLKGKFQPRDNTERLHLAYLCSLKKYHRAAAQLYADAFAAEPKRATDQKAGHRYNAACTAALAGCGLGEDARQLDDNERSRWRKQALDWLRADLTAYGKILDGGNPAARALVRQRLQHWQRDIDLSGLRDKDAVAQLPAEERQACEKLWAEVAALREKTQPTK